MSQHLQPSLVLAPSKHTTVVTTTTVTTTSYAPVPLPRIPTPPSPKDPKLYPLLKAPLPRSLREFPIEFPDGVKALYSDGSQPDGDASDNAWEDELVGGTGWAMLRPSDTISAKDDVLGLHDAVERLNPLKKRPLSAAETSSIDDAQSTMTSAMGESQAQGRYVNAPPRKKARATEQQHSSRPVAGPPSPLPSPHGSPSTPVMWATPAVSQSPPTPSPPFQPDISLAALLSLPNLISHFSILPPQLKSHILVSLMRHSQLSVLRTVHSILAPTLARDFLILLPPELTSIILSYLPANTLFFASRVSKAWRAIIDSDPQVWRDQLRRSGTWYGGPSENAYADRIWALRAKRYDHPFLHPNLPLPHPFKLLFKSRHVTLTRWQQNNPKRLTFPAHGVSVVTCLIFSRRRIISASDDHSINMYSPFNGHLVRSFPGHEGGVWALAVCSRRRKPAASPILTPAHSPSAPRPQPYYHDMLVSGSTDRTVRIWDLQTGQNTHVFGGHTSTVRCLVISRPVWVDAEDGSDRKEKWPKHTMIVTGSRDNTLRVWRLPAPGEEEYRCFGAQTAEGDPSDEDTNENPYHVMALRGHENAVRALAVHGRTIVSGSYDTTVRVWDLVTGECKYTLVGHSQKVYSVVIDHMRKQTCSGSMDGTVRIWSLKDGSTVHVLSGHTSLVGLLSLSATTLVSAAADSTLRIWDPNSGRLLHTLSGHTGAITCFQHDENKVLSGSDGTLKMWDTRDGTVTRDLLTGITGVWQVVFDRRFCIAASNRQDSTFLEVWDFAGESGGDADDDDHLGGDDDDTNSETSDPYDELRLAEGDVEDSESEDDGGGAGGHEDVYPDPDDSDYVMDPSSGRSGTYNSPTPSGSTFGAKGAGWGRARRHQSVADDNMSIDSPDTDAVKSPVNQVVPYPLVWNAFGVASSSRTMTTTTTTSTAGHIPRSRDWPSGSASKAPTIVKSPMASSGSARQSARRD